MGRGKKRGSLLPFPDFPRALYPLYPVSARFFLSMQSERDCRTPLRRRELNPTVLCPHHGERSQTSILQPLPLSSRNDSSLQWGRLRDNQNNDCERLAIPWADEAFRARVVMLVSQFPTVPRKHTREASITDGIFATMTLNN